nr:CTP synthase-like [Lytechinus pictus]
MKKSKIIFVVGGIFSGIGKGIVISSIGNFFKRRGAKIGIIKLDPYLNIDAGRLSPSEHGEVFVTKDGQETDLDLGNYERFLGQDMNKNSFKTLGNVLYKVLEKEKNFEYKGKTIDFKDVRDEVYQEIIAFEARYSPDLLLVEIGGKISDFNIRPFMEAGQKLRNERGKK